MVQLCVDFLLLFVAGVSSIFPNRKFFLISNLGHQHASENVIKIGGGFGAIFWKSMYPMYFLNNWYIFYIVITLSQNQF